MKRSACLLLFVAFVASCGGVKSTGPVNPAAGLGFPSDKLLPGETLDSTGFVVPAADGWRLESGRSASGINESSEIALGADRFDAVGAVADLGQASQLSAAGAGNLSAAIYRLTLGGIQPGAVSADVNLHLAGGGLSEYWLGVADFGSTTWELQGPYADSHVRLDLAGTGDYVSSLGNAFIAVLAHGPAEIDVVAVGAAPRSGDAVAPPAPAALAATGAARGLLLEWTGVVAGDLAGYRVYWSYSPFSATTDNGVSMLNYLEGNTRHLRALPPNRLVYTAVSSVDIDGNESALSEVVSAFTLAGLVPQLEVTTSVASGPVGVVATLSASGAQSYDFDLDGNGDFEISGNVTGTAQIITDQPGIIRPAVRGTGAEGAAIALGSVSLVLTGNPPPVAVLTASDISLVLGETGAATVDFSAAASYDPQGEPLTYAVDPEGDGSYVNLGANDTHSADYTLTGVYLAKLRVTDGAGQSAYDSVAITVRRFKIAAVDTAGTTGVDNSLAIIGGRPAIAYMDLGAGQLKYVRALDAQGRQWDDPELVDDPVNIVGRHSSLAEIDGLPAISYYDETDDNLLYVIALDVEGDSWNAPLVIASTDDVGKGTSLLAVNGRPAIAYWDATNDRLKFARSSAANGYPVGTWSTQNVSFNNLGNSPSMAIIDGNPAIAFGYDGDIGYIRAEDVGGTDWGFPIKVVDPLLEEQDGQPSLADVAGHPAIGFSRHDGVQRDLFYVRATTDTGESASDWPAWTPVLVGPGNVGAELEMGVVGGRPAFVYHDGDLNAMGYVRSLTLSGSGAASWPEPVIANSISAGQSVDILDVGGLPLLSLYSSDLEIAFPVLE